MVLDSKRGFANNFLIPIAKAMKGIEPNFLSAVSLILAFLAAYSFYSNLPLLLLFASLFIFLSGLFDALDGAHARLYKKASKKGDFLDHVIDRYADIVIIGGIMLSSYSRDYLAFFAIVGILMTSYMGTQAQAISGKRHYGGFLTRADRLALLIIFPIMQFFYMNPIYGFSLIEWLMIIFAVVGTLTALQRAFISWRQL